MKTRCSFQIIVLTSIVILPFATIAGEFLRSAGTTSWNKGGQQISITVSVNTSSNQPSPTVTRRSGDTSVSDAMTSTQLQPGRWFAYVENETTVWIFDGSNNLRVVLIADNKMTDSDEAQHLKKCPPDVREALPETVRKKYFHGKGE